VKGVRFHPDAEAELIAAGEFYEALRRFLVRRFPYGLLYRNEPTAIFIVAVMHLRRRPGYWKGRV